MVSAARGAGRLETPRQQRLQARSQGEARALTQTKSVPGQSRRRRGRARATCKQHATMPIASRSARERVVEPEHQPDAVFAFRGQHRQQLPVDGNIGGEEKQRRADHCERNDARCRGGPQIGIGLASVGDKNKRQELRRLDDPGRRLSGENRCQGRPDRKASDDEGKAGIARGNFDQACRGRDDEGCDQGEGEQAQFHQPRGRRIQRQDAGSWNQRHEGEDHAADDARPGDFRPPRGRRSTVDCRSASHA